MRWVHRTRMMMLLTPLALLACQAGDSEPVAREEKPAAEPVVATAPAPEPAPVVQAPAAPKPVAAAPAPAPAPPAGYVPPPITTDVLTMANADPVLKLVADDTDPDTGFAGNAFPPTLSDTDWHRDGWLVNDCMRCHETGVMDGPVVMHKGMPERLVTAKCRTCHVLIPGDDENAIIIVQEDENDMFEDYAFPPVLPNSKAHLDAWTIEDCLRCHEEGVDDAPVVKHESEHLPRLLLKAKCRTCHVQIRAIESDSPPLPELVEE